MTWVLLLVGATLLLPVVALMFLVAWHRRGQKHYTLEHGLDHISKLAGAFSLPLAAIALIYTYTSQQSSDKATAEINHRAAFNAQEQRQLLQETVNTLHGVSDELKINAEASNRAAENLAAEREDQIKRLAMRPNIHILLSLLNPNGGEGSTVAVIDRSGFHRNCTVDVDQDQKYVLLRAEIINVGTSVLQTGSINFETTSLDGGANPTININQIAGLKLLTGDEDDSELPFTNSLSLAVGNLPLTRNGAEKDLRILLRIPRLDKSSERRFRLYANFIGDADLRSGVINLVIRFGKELDTEVAGGMKALQEKRYGEAIHYFENAAAREDPNAMENLGYMFEQGLGMKQDCGKAQRWYGRSVSFGNQFAMSNLGYLYQTGNCVKQDYKVARQWYERSAAAGGAEGMADLGYIYEFGLGVKRDYQQALEWYSKAAAIGNARAMNNLGYMYESGRWVRQDFIQAKQWYEKAAAAGNSQSMMNLASLYENGRGIPQDYVQSKIWYEKAAAAGDSSAMNKLGFMYHHAQGVLQDFQQAREWYQKAIVLHNANAMNSLGYLYQHGLGGPQNYKEALQLYITAAMNNDAAAMNNLVYMYERGEGVSINYARARLWYLKAIAAHEDSAMDNLGFMYELGEGVSRNYTEARRLYLQAALAGNSTTMFNLANTYERGHGIQKDLSKARLWYEKSAAAGDADAQKKLQELSK